VLPSGCTTVALIDTESPTFSNLVFSLANDNVMLVGDRFILTGISPDVILLFVTLILNELLLMYVSSITVNFNSL
jgi:hypothetical protein